eukprot:6180908-Pleurochrysis_carterae.AAC.3
MSDAENKVDIEGCLEKVWEKRTTRKAQTLLKALSLLSGAFMIVAGIIGCSFILYFQVGSYGAARQNDKLATTALQKVANYCGTSCYRHFIDSTVVAPSGAVCILSHHYAVCILTRMLPPRLLMRSAFTT